MLKIISFPVSYLCCNMLYIVDIQYYLHGASKVLKEACLLPILQPLRSKHFAFRSPFPRHALSPRDLTTVNYVQLRLDTLHWEEEEDSLEDFFSSCPAGAILLCNGLEKTLFLQSVLPLCSIANVNIPFSNIFSSSYSLNMHHHCPIRPHLQCAVRRAYQLYNHFNDKQ